MDYNLESLYFDYPRYDMNEQGQPMSLWGPGQSLAFKTASTAQQERGGSTPSTPSYSQSLDLESKMLESSMAGLSRTSKLLESSMAGLSGTHSSCMHTTVISDPNRRQHPICLPPPLIAAPGTLQQGTSSSTASGNKRGRKEFVDPCVIAPLKKRRIQVEMLDPDERDKVLQKREKNKVAAEKCRVKRREKTLRTRAEYEDYLEANESLEAEIQRLKEQRLALQELLDNHHCVVRQQNI